MTWKSIRLELARTVEFPQGSPRHVYILHLPLSEQGLVLGQDLRSEPERATVHRYWDQERPRSGYVIETDHGWALSYQRGDDDDEAIFHLDTHPLVEGQYLTLTEPDGDVIPMRVAGVVDVE